MKSKILKRTYLFVFAFFMSAAVFAEDCQLSLLSKTQWTEALLKQAEQSIVSTSTRLSRSADYGENAFTYLRPTYFLAKKARSNYSKTVSYIMDQFEVMSINEDTAVKINTMLTKGLVPKVNVGDSNYRPDSLTRRNAELLNNSVDFYSWLNLAEAKSMQQDKPIQFAELIHNNITVYDSFPDGNTRTARLMSYIVLMRAGYWPAVFEDKDLYNTMWTSSRAYRKKLYFEAVVRGQR